MHPPEKAYRIAGLTDQFEREVEADGDGDVDEEVLEKEECYFPLDGYDYSRHLKLMTPEGVFEAEVGKDSKEPFLKVEGQTKEEHELLAALDEADEYESG